MNFFFIMILLPHWGSYVYVKKMKLCEAMFRDFIGFWIFWKKNVVALTFVKFELSFSNCTQIYYIHQGTLVLDLAEINWSVQIFSDFEFFEKFLKVV